MIGAGLAAGLAAAEGGFFPESWAWTAVATLVAATVLLIARPATSLGSFDIAYLGGLALFGLWVALSAAWSTTVTGAVEDAWRVLAYVGAVALTLLVVERRAVPQLVGGVLGGVTIVAGYALLTRLLPDRLGDFETLPTLRLADPIGYWNGLGVYCAMGALLALGVAARGRRVVWRSFAAAVPVVLVTALYLTFSRGAWLALAAGLVAAVALDPRRLQLIVVGLAIAPWCALAVVAASRADALSTDGSALARAVEDGRVLLAYVIALSVASGLTLWAFAAEERRVAIGRRGRLAFGGVLVAIVLAAGVWAWASYDSPWSLASDAWEDFRAGPDSSGPDLSGRLFDLSSNGRIELWTVAWDDFRASPLVGEGAGSFEQSFYENRESTNVARDGHSLYAETLGELGVVGLVLLVFTLAVPLVAAMLVRRGSLVVGLAAAYAAYLAHAAVDWDWELAGVTVVALLCGCGLVAEARPAEILRVASVPVRAAAVSVGVVLSGLALWSLIVAVPLGRAREAVISGDWQTAVEQAENAERWAPWASDPWRLRGDAELAQGRVASARESYARAVELEPGEWLLWLDLAVTSTGEAQRRALERAAALNPREEQIRIVQDAVRNPAPGE